MAKEILAQLPYFSVGVIGHIGHGKSALSAAIPQVLSGAPGIELPWQRYIQPREGHWRDIFTHGQQPLPWEERTSRSSVSSYHTERWLAAHFDLPGYYNRVKNVATTLAMVDIAIVVVSAIDSIQPQTREHLLLAKSAGVSRFIIFINFCDQVDDDDWIDAVELESRELLSSLGLDGDGVPAFRGAALPAFQGDPRWVPPILSLIESLESLGTSLHRSRDGDFIFMIERAFAISGKGTVATGKVLQGDLKQGQSVFLSGLNPTRSTAASELKIFQQKKSSITAGDYAGILLRGLVREEVNRGQLVTMSEVQTSITFSCTISLITAQMGGRHTPLNKNHLAQFYFGTTSVSGIISWEGDAPSLSPGEQSRSGLQVKLWYPTHLTPGMKFALCDGSDGLQFLAHEKRWRANIAKYLSPFGPRQWGGVIGFGVVDAVL